VSTEFTPTLNVIVVASDPLARAGLSSLICKEDVYVVAELSSLEHLSVSLSNCVIVWDGSGSLPSEPLAFPLLALVAEDTDAKSYSYAQGLMYKSSSPERILHALYALAQGLTVFEPAFVVRQSARSEDVPTDLTARELEVLRHLAEGMSNKAIAKVLNISENTVKFHVNALLEKFGVGSRTEVVVKAIQNGLVTI
jgi:two-component system, NarL family, nitrate/nitrite response regulator NarL